MKGRCLLLFLLPLILLAACDDGAWQRLQLEELERMNRADSLMTNDSLALDLAEWFDDHGTPNEQMRAYYILGRTYADLGEAPQAIEAYNDAADRADTTDADCDYKTLARVYAQKAEVFYYQLMADKMIDEERIALRYAQKAQDSLLYIACFAMMAEGYEQKSLLDSALYILNHSYHLYKEIGKDSLAAGLCCSMSDIYRQKKEYSKASRYMEEYERTSGFVNEDGDVIPGKEMYYSCKGLLCLETSDIAGAEYYFRKLLANSSTYDLRYTAYYNLQIFYEKQFDKDSLLRYTHLNDSLGNVIHLDVEMDKTLQVQAMYDYSRNERIATQKSHKATVLGYSLALAIALVGILALLFVIFYLQHLHARQLLTSKIQSLLGNDVNVKLQESDVVQRFKKYLKDTPYQIPSYDDWRDLRTLIDNVVPTFWEKLCAEDIELNDFENDVCMLIKIQISTSNIARFKQCTTSNINQTKKRIYKKLFRKSGKADELSEFILSLS